MFRAALAAVVALALYVLVGHDGRHHWHEWRYVYSAANYSVTQLAEGAFDPGPPGSRSAAEVGAWYWGQLYHEVLLRAATRVLGKGLGTIRLLSLFYGLMIPASALFLYGALRRIGRAEIDPLAAALAMMLYPLGTYLGFKLLAEPPALLLAMAAVFLYTCSLDERGARGAGLVLAAAAALGLSTVTMVFFPLLFLGYGVALTATRVGPWGPKRVASRGLQVLALGLAVSWLALGPFGVGVGDYVQMYRYYLGYVKPISVYLFNAVGAVGPALALLPLAWMGTSGPALRFYAIWGLVATLPIFALSTNYLESRYLVVGLPVFGGIAALGLRQVAGYLPGPALRKDARFVRLVVQIAVLALISLTLVPFLPYEMNSRDLVVIARRIWREHPGSAILLPWNYTDFHCLDTMFPGREIYLVQSPLDRSGHPYRDAEWEQRFEHNYGSAFLPDLPALHRRDGPYVYLGQGILPPFARLKRVADVLGLGFVSRRIDSMQPMNHMKQSWLWDDPRCPLDPVASEGEYRAFVVRCSSTEPTRPNR